MATMTTIATNTAVVQHKPLAPLDIAQTKAAMQTYQEGLQSLLDVTDRQTFATRDGDQRSFVKRSGWRKIGTWFELSFETRSIDVDRDPKTGQAIRARVIARAIAPNGRYAEGEGAADKTERVFSKLEHDLQATAATRALNRAISNLVGMGEVSAEEVSVEEVDSDAAPIDVNPYGPYGPVVDEVDEQEAAQIIQRLHPSIDGFILIGIFKTTLGVNTLPEAAYRMLKALEWGASDGAGQVSGNAQAETN
jgi:hypothetical protein